MNYGILILWSRYSNQFIENKLIPEIENNCTKYGIFSQAAYDNYQKNKFAKNSLYIYHGHAESDIPTGIKYEVIARIGKYGTIQPTSVKKCPSKVLSFFTHYPVQPFYQADCGHHGFSLIQFEKEIPQMIYELFEGTQEKWIDFTTQICLGSEEGIQRIIRKDTALRELSKILKAFGIKSTDEFYQLPKSQDKEGHNKERKNINQLYQIIERDIVKKYNLNKEETEEIITTSLDSFWRKQLEL